MKTGGQGRVLYFFGGGRSGTTILAAMLGAHTKIAWFGELVRIVNWRSPDNCCSCAKPLTECPTWQQRGIVAGLGSAVEQGHEYETHRRIFWLLLGIGNPPVSYGENQRTIVRSLVADDEWLLDSSKYVGRALCLERCNAVDARFIYLVRDARGVAYSFGKKVQYRRGLLSACWYYWAMNLMAQLAASTWLRKKALKIRYEDLVSEPITVLRRIGSFLSLDTAEIEQRLAAQGEFEAHHIAGGNRWAKQGAASLAVDHEWHAGMGRTQRLLVHLLCWPLQRLNRYGI